jgi:phage terminase large subunit GpA-like protein
MTHAHDLPTIRRMLQAAVATRRPPEPLTPSQFAERYRILKAGTHIKTGRDDVRWSNDVFPILTTWMDTIQEAIEYGYKGWVGMKPTQCGGSEAVINALLWLAEHYPGPQLYLISTDDLAKQFADDRFEPALRRCEPLRDKFLTGRGSGTTKHIKQLLTGKIAIYGGRSVNKVQTIPYRIVAVDEGSSLPQEVGDFGSLLTMAKQRTDAFDAETLMMAVEHPTTREAGAGKIYYGESNQRRAFVTCCGCGRRFWFSPQGFRATPQGESAERARRNPARYAYHAPCCDRIITDSERWQLASDLDDLRQESQLRPGVDDAGHYDPADVGPEPRTPWIGVHNSQWYNLNRSAHELAEREVSALDDPAEKKVLVQKTYGDCYEHETRATTEDDWRACIAIPQSPNDPHAYLRGQIPPGVQMLTAGQDSRATELHWSVWGWGVARLHGGQPLLRGWLIDYGIVQRDYSPDLQPGDLAVFDGIVYGQSWPLTAGDGCLSVTRGFHDSGWGSTVVYDYCRGQRLATPVKGDSKDEHHNKTPLAPVGVPRAIEEYRLPNGKVIRGSGVALITLNTFALKEKIFSMVGKRIEIVDPQTGELREVNQITLPRDVSDTWIAQNASEARVEKKGKEYFKAKGANHFFDCTVYAYAAARNQHPEQLLLPFGEQPKPKPTPRRRAPRDNAWIRDKPGPWIAQR